MKIIGISAYYHDSAAALIVDGEIIAAVQEERFSRKKHDAAFPANAIKYCLEEGLLDPDQIDQVVFYDKPLLTFERLLETYYAYAPKGLLSFIKAIPAWLKEKLFLKHTIKKELTALGFEKKTDLLFTEHHLSHAASAYYPSPFEKAAILTIDGVGEWATASICRGDGHTVEILRELRFPHSLGLLYSAFTYFLGFRVNSGEYKLMGLAPYGNAESKAVKAYEETIYSQLIDLKDDGSLWLNQAYFSYAHGLRMVPDKKWERLFGMAKRHPSEALTQPHCDLALAIQNVTEKVVLHMAKEAKRLTQCNNLCLAGGVALNCVSNGKLIKEGLFDQVYIQPASGDAGGALGAALAAHHIHNGAHRSPSQPDQMKGSYLGPDISERDIQKVINQYNAKAQAHAYNEIYESTAQLLSEGQIIGWVQGRMEFGPRALGNRSILGDPTNPEMQKKLNLNIKYRESFRPFAPSVLEEDAGQYFVIDTDSPYMLQVQPVRPERQIPKPEDYHLASLKEKLYWKRSDLPAITHIDYSARIQTVSKATNPHYWHLIDAFKAITGYGVVVNTSFNVRGEPIVCTADDAYRCFMRTEMDALVIDNYLFLKKDQPQWQDKDNWQESFTLD